MIYDCNGRSPTLIHFARFGPQHADPAGGAGYHSGRGCTAHGTYPSVPQWHRAGEKECHFGQHSKNSLRARNNRIKRCSTFVSSLRPPTYIGIVSACENCQRASHSAHFSLFTVSSAKAADEACKALDRLAYSSDRIIRRKRIAYPFHVTTTFAADSRRSVLRAERRKRTFSVARFLPRWVRCYPRG